MATVKVTFTIDETTNHLLRDAAKLLAKPKSDVVREAIRDYHARMGRLGERERQRMLRAFDELVPRIPSKPAKEVDAEIRSVRQARRTGGRRSGGTRRR